MSADIDLHLAKPGEPPELKIQEITGVKFRLPATLMNFAAGR